MITGVAVELWHRSCWAVRHARGVEPVAVIAPRPTHRSRWVAGAAAVITVIAISIVHAREVPAASLASFDLDEREVIAEESPVTARELMPARPLGAETDLQQSYEVPIVDDQPLDELYPSLADWTHPVTGSSELMPAQASRHFGADRIGVTRTECGGGHCGVDLDGPRGRPVVAVSDGVVVRVERHELGLDGRSGRYVRIEHDDGTLTAYMHLDDIVEGLEVGDRVDGGELIGTLGATAVYASVPHLHFSLEVPNHPGRHGDNTDTHYVDPAPFLVRAHIAPAPDRRLATKPAL